jgi:hypothetical protein
VYPFLLLAPVPLSLFYYRWFSLLGALLSAREKVVTLFGSLVCFAPLPDFPCGCAVTPLPFHAVRSLQHLHLAPTFHIGETSTQKKKSDVSHSIEMKRGNYVSNRSGHHRRGNGSSQPPPTYPPPPPPPFPDTPLPPPPPPPALDRSRYIKPKQVSVQPLPFTYDPYGGVPRREDKDPYNTSQPPPPPKYKDDLRPTACSFRDVVLSTQSWGARYPEPTETSIKRWVRRSVRAETPILPKKNNRPLNQTPAASSSAPLVHEELKRGEGNEAVKGKEARPTCPTEGEADAKGQSNGNPPLSGQTPPPS